MRLSAPPPAPSGRNTATTNPRAHKNGCAVVCLAFAPFLVAGVTANGLVSSDALAQLRPRDMRAFRKAAAGCLGFWLVGNRPLSADWPLSANLRSPRHPTKRAPRGGASTPAPSEPLVPAAEPQTQAPEGVSVCEAPAAPDLPSDTEPANFGVGNGDLDAIDPRL